MPPLGVRVADEEDRTQESPVSCGSAEEGSGGQGERGERGLAVL